MKQRKFFELWRGYYGGFFFAIFFISIIPAFCAEIKKEDLPKFYRPLFKDPYEYMFQTDEPPTAIKINSHTYGQFMAGIRGFLFYWSFTDCAAQYLKIKKNEMQFDDLSSIEKLSGINIFVKSSSNSTEFSHYNPAIIIWGRDNLIPSPSDEIFGCKLGEIYQKIFKRFFRLLVESYLVTHRGKFLEEEQNSYQKKMTEKNFDALTYLDEKFKDTLPDYKIPMDGTSFTPQMAIGFWVRRSLDNTDAELWIALQKLMSLFDREWFESMEKKG